MAVIEFAVRTVHVLAGGLLAGSVVFFTWAALRSGTDGPIGTPAVTELARLLTNVSRFCAVLLVLSGGYMATVAPFGSDPTYDGLLGLMILLWLAITALVEVGYAKLRGDGTFDAVRTHYLVAASAGVLLLVDAGILAGY